MRLSSSSSLLLATLALSSSSSTLAAPADHTSLQHSSLPSSSSMRAFAVDGTREVPLSTRFESPSDPSTDNLMSVHPRALLDIAGLLGGLPPPVGPLLQGLLGDILDTLGLKLNTANSQSVPATLSKDQMKNIAEFLDGARSKMAHLASNGQTDARRRDVAGDATSSSVNPSSSVSPSYASSANSTSMSSTASASHSSSSTTTTSSGPTSPALPVNPPNTPVPSKPPVPAGAQAPPAVIARDAPPMFPGFKAADVDTTTSSNAGPTATLSSGCDSFSASESSNCPSTTGNTTLSSTSSSGNTMVPTSITTASTSSTSSASA